MLRIDTAAQLTVHCYYHVLGYKSEGGTGGHSDQSNTAELHALRRMRRQRPIHTISKQAVLWPERLDICEIQWTGAFGVGMMKEMKGVCLLFSETGTEGGWWAIQAGPTHIKFPVI